MKRNLYLLFLAIFVFGFGSKAGAQITGPTRVCAGSEIVDSDLTCGGGIGTWTSLNTAVATVTSAGVITGVAAGTTYILVEPCADSVEITVLAAPGAITITRATICTGTLDTVHDATSGGTWSSSNTAVASVGSAGGVRGLGAGIATIDYTLSDGCSTTTDLTVDGPSAISPHSPPVCMGSTVTLTDAVTGGTWLSTGTTIATVGTGSGIVTGVTAGAAIIDYTTYTPGFGTCSVRDTVTVTNGAGTISPTTAVTVCVGSFTDLTDAATGGTWSSVTTSIATVTSAGHVYGASPGADTIKYSVAGGCSTYKMVTVNAPSPISPNSPSICVGDTVTLTEAESGGIWLSGTTSVATIGSGSGIVTGVLAGTTVITYYSSCPAYDTVHITNGAGTISPSGTVSFCTGSSASLSDASTGGIWSSSNTAVATVSSTGTVFGASRGTATIIYTLGSCSTSKVVTIIGPVAMSPDQQTICVGEPLTLTDGTTGGTWSGGTTGIATITTGGIVTASGAGVTSFYYTQGGCNVGDTLTVTNGAGAITGTSVLCAGTTANLSDTVSGGTWSSHSTAVATVDGSGTVTGVAGGTTIITYTTGSCYTTTTVTVAASTALTPATSSLCVGSSETFTEPALTAPFADVWIGSNTSIATVSSSGSVTGISPGVDTISYQIYDGGSVLCGYTATVTVNTAPVAITPSGVVSVCSGASTSLADATSGGTWGSLSTGVATVSSGGTVYGVTSGSATISYSIGSCSVNKSITVLAGPAAISPSSATLCTGTTTSLTDATSGGVWSSGSTGVATVASGTIGGVAAGTAIISYTVGTCRATAAVTVNSSPVAMTPSGAVTICSSATTTLGETTTGGAWGSGNTAVATVSGGVVYGVSAGSVTISYSVGSCYATKSITVIEGPAAISASSSTVCTGTTASLTDATSGGAWSSGSTATATVSPTGVVYGVAAGTTTIQYLSGSCSATKTVTVVSAPAAITPSSAVTLCEGSTVALADAVTGGSWSSGATGTATVSEAGVVTGVAGGTVTITYTSGLCYVTKLASVITGPTALSPASPMLCAGGTLTLTDAVSGGTWSSSLSTTATVSSTGEVSGVSAGTVNIYYIIGSCVATSTVTITPSPSIGSISGSTAVCVGSTTPLTDVATGGAWSSSNTAVATVTATGVVHGVSSGTAIISYTNTSSCGVIAATHIVTANTTPSAGTITGATSICAGTTSSLSNTVTGGTWAASNASVSVNITTGLLTGITPGVDTITYKVITSCGIASTTTAVTVGSFLSAGTITGGSSLCGNTTISLTDAGSAGGVWSSSNSSATVGSISGIVTGAAAGGIDTISFTSSAACGTAVATHIITVNPAPEAGDIVGVSAICVGTSVTLADGATGGSWSASNTNATVVGGVVTAVSPGSDIISYSVTNGCGTATATLNVTISTIASAGTITGPGSVCPGSPITLTDATGGGAWSSSNTFVAVVGTGGAVSGVSAGAVTISYTVSSSCGAAVATFPVDVSGSSLSAGSISGISTLCIGSFSVFSDGVGGGVWSASNGHATITSGGLVTGISLGTDTISYVVANSCGVASTSFVVTVLPSSSFSIGPISSLSIVCVGSGITLVDATPGGTWEASNGHAIVVGAGIIDGVSPGIDTISYIVSGTCGSGSVIKVLNVDTIPIVPPITGVATQCIGTTTSLSDPSGGGVWTTSTSSVATVNLSSGMVAGLSTGTATITYTVTNLYGCPGIATITDVVTPTTVTTGITGSSSVCAGSSVMLSDATSGGSWSSSNTGVAVIDPATGDVTGVAPGTTTISYTVVNSCGVSILTSIETVGAPPSVSAISGTATGCVGSPVAFTDATIGGVWSSSSTAIATIDASGNVTGVSSGPVTINYTVTGVSGCSLTVGASIFIDPAPTVAAITGTASECTGSSASLADGTGSGAWSSSNTAVATVDASGNVTGITAGTAIISYIISSSGCPGIATVTDVVDGIPGASAITGVLHVCPGATTALGSGVGGGVWSSGSAGIAMVDASSGVVTGVSGGTAEIYYAVSNACGSATDSAAITVYPGPTVGAISAAYTAICTGNMLDVSDGVSGGIWVTSNTTIASVTGAGVVTGLATGIDTIYYVVTNSHGCSSSAMISITIGGTIAAATVDPAGAVELCKGHIEYMHVTSLDGVTYQWLRNTSVIAGATDSSYSTSAIGNYAVVVSNGICSETVSGPSVTAPTVPAITFTAPNELSTGSFRTYQWFRNGVLIAGATDNTIDESAGGVYTVVVTDANGCSDTSSGYTVGGTTGINGTGTAQNIKVYPNPATTMLHIDAPVQVNVSVLSIDGQVIIAQQNASDVDVTSLADGMYMVLVYDQNGLLLKTTKFVKAE